jgi:hypothetical protein
MANRWHPELRTAGRFSLIRLDSLGWIFGRVVATHFNYSLTQHLLGHQPVTNAGHKVENVLVAMLATT